MLSMIFDRVVFYSSVSYELKSQIHGVSMVTGGQPATLCSEELELFSPEIEEHPAAFAG